VKLLPEANEDLEAEAPLDEPDFLEWEPMHQRTDSDGSNSAASSMHVERDQSTMDMDDLFPSTLAGYLRQCLFDQSAISNRIRSSVSQYVPKTPKILPIQHSLGKRPEEVYRGYKRADLSVRKADMSISFIVSILPFADVATNEMKALKRAGALPLGAELKVVRTHFSDVPSFFIRPLPHPPIPSN